MTTCSINEEKYTVYYPGTGCYSGDATFKECEVFHEEQRLSSLFKARIDRDHLRAGTKRGAVGEEAGEDEGKAEGTNRTYGAGRNAGGGHGGDRRVV